MPTGTFFGGWGTPGSGAQDLTAERNILAGYGSINGISILTNAVLDGAARDTGNSPTNVCRAGLTLGKISSSGHYTAYSASNSDGSQTAVGFLYVEALTQDFSGNNADRVVPIVISGYVKASQLIGLDALARAQLGRQFLFDDDLGGKGRSPLVTAQVAKTANYTVVAADNGTSFSTTGASGSVTFTLPAVTLAGFFARFFNSVEQTMTVSSAEGSNMVMPGFTAAAGGSNYIFQTPGQRSGGCVEVYSDGTNWWARSLSENAITTS